MVPSVRVQLLAALPLLLLGAAFRCGGAASSRVPPPPHCPRFHSFHGDQDPSAPIQTPDRVWHVFPINGAWSHCTSRDLLHWNCSHPKTGMPIWNTGSITVTPSGYFAIQANNYNLTMAKASGPDLIEWEQNVSGTSCGTTINATGKQAPVCGVVGNPVPAFPGTESLSGVGRGLHLRSGIYVPVGTRGPRNAGGGVHWFRAEDDTMNRLVYKGFLWCESKHAQPLFQFLQRDYLGLGE